MNLRAKVFLIVGILLFILFFSVDRTLSYIIEKNFLALEYREAEKNTLRVADALEEKIDGLSVKLSDWSQWDDTYEYVTNQNEEYVESNLQNEALGILKINLFVITDTSGSVIFKKYVEDNEERPFPENFASHLQADIVQGHIEPGKSHKETILFPEGVVVYVLQPVTSSDGKAVSNGYIVFGYYLNQGVIDDISRITHLDAKMIPSDEASRAKVSEDIWTNISLDHPVGIQSFDNEDSVRGYALVGNDHNESVLLLQVSMDREILSRGKESLAVFTRALMASAGIFMLILFFLLDWLVLKKISSLSQQVARIGSDGGAKNPIVLPGKDEFSQLADHINAMVRSLYEAELKRKESEKRFRTVADSAPVMIWMSDANKKNTYVNKVWLDFTGRSLEDELGVGWKADIHPDDLKMTEDLYADAFSKQQPFNVEYRLRRKDGTYGWVFSRAIPHFTVDNVFLGYVGSCTDITERKETEEQKQRYVEEVEKMNRIMVERELKMIELKKELKNLQAKI